MILDRMPGISISFDYVRSHTVETKQTIPFTIRQCVHGHMPHNFCKGLCNTPYRHEGRDHMLQVRHASWTQALLKG